MSTQETEFGSAEEKAIIALSFDAPEFFSIVANHLKVEHFNSPETKFVYAIIQRLWNKYETVPTRRLVRDYATKNLTPDDSWEEIVEIIDTESDPKEAPMVRDLLVEWARNKAFGLIYADDAIEAYEKGDYGRIESIVEAANRISNVADSSCMWFFESQDSLFREDLEEKLTTGFSRLDLLINEGGPTYGDTFAWMAPTGVGKCHTLESKIIEEKLSTIYEIEMEDGKIIKLAGYEEISTARGKIKVCDLSEDDDISQIPNRETKPDLYL